MAFPAEEYRERAHSLAAGSAPDFVRASNFTKIAILVERFAKYVYRTSETREIKVRFLY